MLTNLHRTTLATALCASLLLPTPATLAQQPASEKPTRAKHAMVVSTEHNASDAGLAILKQGGNAVDASVAVGFALAVTYPRAGNLGGGGFMLIRDKSATPTSSTTAKRPPAPPPATCTSTTRRTSSPTNPS